MFLLLITPSMLIPKWNKMQNYNSYRFSTWSHVFLIYALKHRVACCCWRCWWPALNQIFFLLSGFHKPRKTFCLSFLTHGAIVSDTNSWQLDTVLPKINKTKNHEQGFWGLWNVSILVCAGCVTSASSRLYPLQLYLIDYLISTSCPERSL